MDRSECEIADWEIIGLEDGAVGRQTSYIGQHRSACAEYAIKPDLTTYLKGHKKGLIQYCVYPNGFNLGKRGKVINNVCNGLNSGDFVGGYNVGKQHFVFLNEIKLLEQQLIEDQEILDSLELQIERNKEIIIKGETNYQQRRQLLEEIELFRVDLEQIKEDIALKELRLFKAEERYDRFIKQ